ncbi:CLUMA_CG003165, isoform A, partial [Clunio marinus]
MDLMSALCSDDYNQPNSESATLKLKSRPQSKLINKAVEMAYTECSINRQSSTFCEKKVTFKKRLRPSMSWKRILV